MSRTYDNEKKPSQSTFSFKPTASFLQTRPFAPIQTDLDEDATRRPSGYTENFLEKIINQRGTESADTPVQPKRMNRLQTLQAKRMSMIQAKLSIGEPNDKYEQEANAVAAQVVQKINQPQTQQSVQRVDEETENKDTLQMKPLANIQRFDPPGEEEPKEEIDDLQMKPLANIQRFDPPGEEEPKEEIDDLQMKPTLQRVGRDGGEISQELESEIQSARGSGSALDPALQRSMRQSMGADFSGVKIHTDSQSDQLNQVLQAKAFTTGSDVFFRAGEYNPSSKSGQELIAHELTHVVQQSGGTVQKQSDTDTEVSSSLQSKSLSQDQRDTSEADNAAQVPAGGYKIKLGNIGTEIDAKQTPEAAFNLEEDSVTVGSIGYGTSTETEAKSAFGAAGFRPSFKGLATEKDDVNKSVKLSFNLDVVGSWGVNSGGKIDVPNGTSPVITKDNYQTIVSDLTPVKQGGSWRAPRTQYWSQAICERHEKYHLSDNDQWARSTGVQVIKDYLEAQTIPGTDVDKEVEDLMTTARADLIEKRTRWFRGPEGTAYVDYPGEIRANADGKQPYLDLAAAVKEQGEKLSIVTRPRSNAVAEPKPTTRPRSNAISKDRLDADRR